ncbi:uncharacterized protein LOC135115370 [Scylla paramamosain]|uniref:uncharacterized protein LOC135115370 n=1 Tax=Scylla paramamosain TaxID=85552 RepID=UPI003082C130
MANVAMMAISWTSVILRSLPEIIKAGHELYSLWCSIRGEHQGNEAVVKSMKLLNRYQDDIGRLLQDPQQKRDLLEGLTILMNRINESNDNNNTGSPRASGRNTTSSGGGDSGASFPSKSSFKGARWMECDVCREDYTTTTTKRPLILHCGHTFCRECVEVLARRGLIRCPTCRKCEMRSLASIPTNTVMISMLEDWGNQGDNDSCNGMSKGKSSCTGDRGSGSGSGCDSISLSYKEQIQFAIFLSKQEAEAQGEAQVERRWQEVEEAADMMLAEALQVSEMYEASRLCAERQQAASAPGSHDLPEEEKESCAASGSGSAEDEDASVLLAYKLQQEEIAMMQRLCGNASNDWSKEMNCFFGPSLCGMGEDGNNFRGRDNATNGREQDSGEDGTTCCRGMEDEDNDDEGGAACHRRGDDGEDEAMCCGREEEEEGGKKCSNSDEDDDLKKCCGDSCREEECDKRFLELMKSEEALLVEMALQLSLHYPQPSDSEDK